MPKIELQEFIEIHDQPFVVIDSEYRIVAANQRYCHSHDVLLENVIDRRCYEISHHAERPCHEYGEECPHQVLFGKSQTAVVLHTHYHTDGHIERTRIRSHLIRGLDGQVYLGEALYPLEIEAEVGCETMRMVGHSSTFLACVDNLVRVAECEASVLLFGESGVGKELAARFIHDRSPRSPGAFIAINCAAVPENMFETELFGHERGAFTGSIGLKKGLFELADKGTLFLDEVAEIPFSLQAKLLRVLETGEFRRVGGTSTLHTDARIVSATNRNLLERIDQKLFRQDLYYRLAGIDVTLPALRERREDIPALAETLLSRMSGNNQHPCLLGETAIRKLRHYDFPGNVRELRNLLQRAMLRCQGGIINAEDIQFGNEIVTMASSDDASPPPNSLKEVEQDHIRTLLAQHNGHRRKVADQLGITERTLYRKLKQYNLSS
jgi:transcriptional regulator with PAS, ATPase and Fis domain